MTENDIIKALNCCFLKYECESCPLSYFGECSIDCMEYLSQETINHITRLIEEKKALLKCLSKKKEIIAEMDEEIERLKEFEYAYNSLFK